MKSVIKYLFIVIGGLLGIVLLVILALNVLTQNRLNKQYEVSVTPIPIPEDESARVRGKHLVRAVSSCVSCHGTDLGGAEFIDEAFLAQIYAPNLTSGKGGKASLFSSQDWVRALRHGVDQTGRPLVFMPAQYFRYYSDADLGAIVAYIESVPPVDRDIPPRRFFILGQALYFLNTFGETAAEIIDHRSVPPQPPQEGVTPEYGEFLVNVGTCKNCHGENLAGSEVGPGDPFAPNLTPGGELIGWTEEDFLTLMRTGVHPTGRKIDSLMPWQSFRNMTDTELRAIWAYLQGLPALSTNEDNE